MADPEYVVIDVNALREPLLRMLGREPAGIVQTGVVLAVLREHGVPACREEVDFGSASTGHGPIRRHRRFVTDWREPS